QHLSLTALVATHDAGAVRYFGRRHVLDIFGNNDARMSELLSAAERAEAAGDEVTAASAGQAVLAYLHARDPDALAVFPLVDAVGHAPELARLPPEQQQVLVASGSDYAGELGLGKRVATFHVPGPADGSAQSATVGGFVQADFAVFTRP